VVCGVKLVMLKGVMKSNIELCVSQRLIRKVYTSFSFLV
jgi:hypothetical protein